jgi:hypothetical protein
MIKSEYKITMKKDRIYEAEIDKGISLIVVVSEEDMHVQECRLVIGDGVVLEMLPPAIPFLQIVTDIINKILEKDNK